jgi:hypothetical protein
MKKRKAIKRAAKAVPATKPKLPRPTPVEKAWLKFAGKFEAFYKMPSNEHDKKVHKAWEAMLSTTDRAAYNVMRERAVCLRDMEIKIMAWAFIAETPKEGTLDALQNWQPGRYMCDDGEFIASLRDDIRAMKQLVRGAAMAVGSIQYPPVLASAPRAVPYVHPKGLAITGGHHAES